MSHCFDAGGSCLEGHPASGGEGRLRGLTDLSSSKTNLESGENKTPFPDEGHTPRGHRLTLPHTVKSGLDDGNHTLALPRSDLNQTPRTEPGLEGQPGSPGRVFNVPPDVRHKEEGMCLVP